MRTTKVTTAIKVAIQSEHLESVVAVVRAEQAGIVAELDARQVPLGDGCRSTVEWLSGRLNLAAETAGASKPLLVHFAQNARLTPEEVRELKEMLDQSLEDPS